MTRDNKQELASILMYAAGNLLEYWGEQDSPTVDIAKKISREEAAEALASWLKHLPGKSWDVRIPEPK